MTVDAFEQEVLDALIDLIESGDLDRDTATPSDVQRRVLGGQVVSLDQKRAERARRAAL